MKRGTWTRVAAGLVLGLGLTLLNPTAEAQEARRRGRNVVRLDAFKIEGTIQKPQAFYILQRSNLNFEGLELKNSFVPKIIKSVEQAPF